MCRKDEKIMLLCSMVPVPLDLRMPMFKKEFQGENEGEDDLLRGERGQEYTTRAGISIVTKRF